MADFFIMRDGDVKGPYSTEQIKSFAEHGKFRKSDKIKKDNGQWQEIGQVKGLNARFVPNDGENQKSTRSLPKASDEISRKSDNKIKKSGFKKTVLLSSLFFGVIVLGGLGFFFLKKGSIGGLDFIGSKVAPYSDFSKAYSGFRKAEWDNMVAANKTKSDLTTKAIDELEKVFRKSSKVKNLPDSFQTPWKLYKDGAKGGSSKVIVGEDAEVFYTRVIAKSGEYFTAKDTPKITVDSSSDSELGLKSVEKIRFNAIPSGLYNFLFFGDKPIEELKVWMNIATEEERKGELDHLLCIPFGLEGKGAVLPVIDDYAIQALDKDSKVILQGRIRSNILLQPGKTVEVKGYLLFSSLQDIDRISSFSVVKKPDEEFLAFVSELQKAMEAGAAGKITALVNGMRPSWSKKFIEVSDSSLKTSKPTTRVGIALALRDFFARNVDKEAFNLLGKLIEDDDINVAKAAIRVGDGLNPCPSEIIQKIMWAATNRKDDARKDAVEFILHLDPAVPENISLFLKEAESTDPGIRSIAAVFLSKAKLDPKTNLELGSKFVQADEEAVVNAGIEMIAKISEVNREKAIENFLPLLSNRFDSSRNLAEKSFNSLAPFSVVDIPKLLPGLKEKRPESKIRVLEIFSGLKNDAKSVVAELLPLLKDDSDEVRVGVLSSIGEIKPDYNLVSAKLFDAAKDKSAKVRSAAVLALSLVGRDPKVVELVLDGMGDPDPIVPKACLQAFSNLKPPINKDDLPVIGARLTSEKIPVKRQAFLALEKTGDAGVVYAREVSIALDDADPETLLSALNCALKYPDKIKNGQEKSEKLLANLLSAQDERHAVACLDYLAFFGPKALTAIPTLKKLFSNGEHNKKTVSALKLVRAIGRDASVLIPEMTKLITKPQLTGIVQNQQQAKILSELILGTNNNMVLRDAMASTGEPGAKILARNLLDPDPMVKALSLLSLEAMGADAKTAMPMIYRSTVPANERNPAILYIAQMVYGRLQSTSNSKN